MGNSYLKRMSSYCSSIGVIYELEPRSVFRQENKNPFLMCPIASEENFENINNISKIAF